MSKTLECALEAQQYVDNLEKENQELKDKIKNLEKENQDLKFRIEKGLK